MAGDLGLDANTVRAHAKILEDLFLVRQLKPWHVNLGSRQIKSPKLYVVDSGFLAYLVGANERRISEDGAFAGAMLDERFSKIAAEGERLARPELAHSLHVEVEGLRPGREYFYRFKAGSEISPVGRTKTVAAPGTRHPLSFAFASCQHYEHGFYTAYRHLAKEDLDLVLHLGDYIYDYAPGEYPSPSGAARTYRRPGPVTLAGYRDRYAEHRSDRDLQAAHQAFPWVVTWDDHEVKDNYAGKSCRGSTTSSSPAAAQPPIRPITSTCPCAAPRSPS